MKSKKEAIQEAKQFIKKYQPTLKVADLGVGYYRGKTVFTWRKNNRYVYQLSLIHISEPTRPY